MASSVPKSTLQSFLTDWNGRKAWAQSVGIPYNDFAATVHYDWQRMTSSEGFGTKMSDPEAFNAMLTLKSGGDPFSTPQSTAPSFFSNPFDAIRNDVQGLVTGLFHAPQAIYHDFDQAIHGHFGGVAQLIPGYMDVTDLFSSQGRQYLSQHPISDILDFSGGGKLADWGEAALNQMGATTAADLLHMVPDHPVSKSIKQTFGLAASRIQMIASLKEHGSTVLGALGQDYKAKQFIAYPLASAMRGIKNTPWPDVLTKFSPESLKLGDIPVGPTLRSQMKELTAGMGEDEVNTAVNMFNLSEINPLPPAEITGSFSSEHVTTPQQFFDNPNITDKTKALYAAFKQASLTLKGAEESYGHTVTVRNEFTNEEGIVPAGENEYTKFVARFHKAMDSSQKKGLALRSALSTVYKTIKHINDEDSAAPAPLRLGQDVVNTPTAYRRAADYYTNNGRGLFQGQRLTSSFRRSLERNFGSDGILNNLANKLPSLRNYRDVAGVVADINSLQKSLLRISLPHDQIYMWLMQSLEDMKSTVKQLDVQKNIPKLNDDAAKAQKTVDRMMSQYNLNWNKYTQGKYYALVQRQLKHNVLQYFYDHYKYGELHAKQLKDGTIVDVTTPEMIERVMIAAERLGDYGDPLVQQLLPYAQLKELTDNAWMSINDMKGMGYEPFFTSAIKAKERTFNPESLGDVTHYKKTTAEFERNPRALLTDSIYDPRYGIPKEAIGLYRQQLVRELIDTFFKKLAMTNEDIVNEARQDVRAHLGDVGKGDTAGIVDAYTSKHRYVPWDPTDPFNARSVWDRRNPDQLWIKDYHLKLMTRSVSDLDKSISGAYNTFMQAYRFGVLFASPRYAAHITLGGATMTLLRLEHPFLSPIKFFNEALNMSRDLHAYGAMLPRGVSEQGLHGEIFEHPYKDFMDSPRVALKKDPEGSWNALAGMKLGQLFRDAVAKRTGLSKAQAGLLAYRSALEHVSDFYRSIAYLEGRELARPEDFTPQVMEEAKLWGKKPNEIVGLHAARKVLADMDAVSPMERAVIMRYMVPFWGWSRHVVRYLVTYPSDHPLRASILSSISNQAVGENADLPDYLFRLLFLGQPNAQGNVTVLDTRQWNPFRDVANYMTWGGIMSTLNPVLQAITASAWGVNSATGEPDIYPQLTYDAFYGSETAAPTGGNFFVDVARQISPQIDTLLQVAKSTSALRQEAATNPGTLGYLIGDSLGFPWIPHNLNVKQEVIKGSTDETSLAGQAVTQALVQNSLAPLAGYGGLLPLPGTGYYVNRNFIQQLINQAINFNKANPQTPVNAQNLLALPYSSPYAPEAITTSNSGQTQESLVG